MQSLDSFLCRKPAVTSWNRELALLQCSVFHSLYSIFTQRKKFQGNLITAKRLLGIEEP